MKINKNMEKALNNQINKELHSGYLYLAMAAYFESINLSGFAHWMKKQAEEEQKHAMKIFDFVIERGGEVKLEEIARPQAGWDSPLDAFKAAYKHELFITESINELVDISDRENDKATHIFLHWYVDEQVEEEASADEIVEKLKMIGESKNGLFMLDSVLKKR